MFGMIHWYVFSKKMALGQRIWGNLLHAHEFHIDLPNESHTEDNLVVMGNSMLRGVWGSVTQKHEVNLC